MIKRFTRARRPSENLTGEPELGGHAVVPPAQTSPSRWRQGLIDAALFSGLIVMLGWLSFQLWWVEDRGLSEWRRLTDVVAARQQENARLQARNDVLKHEIASLKQGQDALEERARSELGMIRDGETFVQIVKPRTETGAGAHD